MKKLAIAVGAVSGALAASSAMAFDVCQVNPSASGCATSVPEISALEGMAAVAALAAVVLLFWERRRRAA